MIVTVRRWTSIALPRINLLSKTSKSNKSQNAEPTEQHSFLNTYNRMFEHQVNLMFRDDYTK
jgi:uncharacterized protein YnzC (UPF0291/DUF896 family)